MTTWNETLRRDAGANPREPYCPWCRRMLWCVVPTTTGWHAARCVSCGAQAPEADSVEGALDAMRSQASYQPLERYEPGMFARDAADEETPMFTASILSARTWYEETLADLTRHVSGQHENPETKREEP